MNSLNKSNPYKSFGDETKHNETDLNCEEGSEKLKENSKLPKKAIIIGLGVFVVFALIFTIILEFPKENLLDSSTKWNFLEKLKVN